MSEIAVFAIAILNALILAMNLKLYTEIMKERCQSARRSSDEGKRSE
jgi:hypothetical protein